MNLEDKIISRITKTQKLFNFDLGHCSYINTETYQKKRTNDQDHQVKIFNTICKQHENKLFKCTQIQFRDKIVIIEDVYRFESENYQDASSTDRSTATANSSSDGSQGNNNPDQQESKYPKKKKLIFKKKLLNGDKSIYQMQKRNTKNVAKNFCRAFLTYLEDKNYAQISNKTKELIKIYKFNNLTVERIAMDKEIAFHFKHFLVTKAQQWINTSKINDKQIHKQAIQLYLELIEKASDKADDPEQFYMDEEKSGYNSDELFEEENHSNDLNQNQGNNKK